MSTPVYKVGDLVSHCDTHGGPSLPGDMQEDRWRPAMRQCEILTVTGPDGWGHYTYGIRHTDGEPSDRVVAGCWLSPNADTRPPYFSRTIKWPYGSALALNAENEVPGHRFFVAFRLDLDSGAYALHSNTAEVSDEVERTFHARRHTLDDLANELSDLARLRNLCGYGPDVFARLIRGLVASDSAAPAWVMDWVGVTEEDAKHFRPKPADEGAKSIGEQVVELAKDARKRGRKVVIAEAQAKAANADKAGEDARAPAGTIATLEEVGAKEHEGVIVCHEGEPPALPVEAPSVVAPAPILPTHFRGVLLRPATDWADPSAEGVFVGVSNEAYHDCPSFSGTAAARHMKSPAHSRLPFDGAARSRDIGTLVHGDILEGKDAAALGFAVVEGKTTTKPNTVTTDMVAIAKACAAALREDPTTALVATLPGLRELSCRARCMETGLMLRCRFDLAPETMGWAWDVKTTSSEDPGAFDNSFGEFGYAVSGAHYLRVATLVGLPFRAMRYACVSTSAPHETWVKTFGPIPGCEDLFPLAMSAAINAAKAEANGRATGEWKKRRHEPSVAELKPWHLTALRQMANGEGVPY